MISAAHAQLFFFFGMGYIGTDKREILFLHSICHDLVGVEASHKNIVGQPGDTAHDPVLGASCGLRALTMLFETRLDLNSCSTGVEPISGYHQYNNGVRLSVLQAPREGLEEQRATLLQIVPRRSPENMHRRKAVA